MGWDLKESKWKNPFPLYGITREECVAKYKDYILKKKELMNSLYELSGKRLGCWCAPQLCHGHVLVELFKEHCMGEKDPEKKAEIESSIQEEKRLTQALSQLEKKRKLEEAEDEKRSDKEKLLKTLKSLQ
jgi:3'-phosphoadenosine 5'-phosphosulfate sulfotransferase (PAPS reductase)/FAD synthetase